MSRPEPPHPSRSERRRLLVVVLAIAVVVLVAGGPVLVVDDGRDERLVDRIDTNGRSMAFSADGGLLAVLAQGARTVLLWDAETRAHESFEVFPPPGTGTVKSIALSPDGALLAGLAWGPVSLWDVETHELVATLKGPGERDGEMYLSDATTMAFAPDGGVLAVGTSGGMVQLWDTETHELIETLEVAGEPDHGGGVVAVAFSVDGSRVAAATESGMLRLWNGDTYEPIQASEALGDRGLGRSVAISPDGRLLAVMVAANGDQYGDLHPLEAELWNFETQQQVGTLDHGHYPDHAASAGNMPMAFSPDGRLLATGDPEGTVRLWDVETREVVERFDSYVVEPLAHDYDDWVIEVAEVRAIAFSPNGSLLATSGDDEVRIWEPRALTAS